MKNLHLLFGCVLFLPTFSLQLMVFHWCLSDRKSSQVSRTLINILVDRDSSFVLQLFQSLFQSSGDRSKYTNYNWHHRHPRVPQYFFVHWESPRIYLLIVFYFHTVIHWNGKIQQYLFFFLFFFLIINRSGLLAGIWGSICITKSMRIFDVSFLRDGFWLVHIPFGCMVEIKSLAQFLVDYHSHPVMPGLYSYSASLTHLLTMELLVLSLSLHGLHLLFWCKLSIFVLT